MKILISIFYFAFCVHLSYQNKCTSNKNVETVKYGQWDNDECRKYISNQIQVELNASITYVAMGAHFSRVVSYRPNVAEFFFESANEERGHAKKLLDYLRMRGSVESLSIEKIASLPIEPNMNVEEAFEAALNLEERVRKSINEIIIICENPNAKKPAPETTKTDTDAEPIINTPDCDKNDYHAVDYLTGEFLQEQHESARQLAGLLATLRRMKGAGKDSGNLAEVIFDKDFSKIH